MSLTYDYNCRYFYLGTYKEFVDIENSTIYTSATILDPRFKLAAFQSRLKATIAKNNVLSEISETCRLARAAALAADVTVQVQ